MVKTRSDGHGLTRRGDGCAAVRGLRARAFGAVAPRRTITRPTSAQASWSSWLPASALLLLGGCAAILGIETFEERHSAAGGAGGGAVAGGGGTGGGVAHGGGGDGSGATAGGGAGGATPFELEHVWSVRYGDPNTATTDQVATRVVSRGAELLVSGAFKGHLDIAPVTPLASADGNVGLDGFVAGLSDATGEPLWAEPLGGVNPQSCRGIALSNAGTVVVGQYTTSITLGTELHSGLGIEIFVAGYGAAGDYLWSRSFGGAGTQYAMGVAVDPGSPESHVVVGRYDTGFFMDGSQLASSGPDFDLLVAKIDANHDVVWAKGFGSVAADSVSEVAIDASGNVVVAGTLGADAFFDDVAVGSAGYGALVAKLSPAGEVAWATSFGGVGSDEAHALALDSSGNVIVAGYFQQSASFGGAALDAVEGADAFVVKLDPDGVVQWVKPIGGPGEEVAHALAIASDDSIYVAGRFDQTANAGGEPMGCGSGKNVFLVRLASNGEHLYSRCFGITGNHYPTGLAVTPDDALVIAGNMDGAITFGAAQLSDGSVGSDGISDLFVAKLAPR